MIQQNRALFHLAMPIVLVGHTLNLTAAVALNSPTLGLIYPVGVSAMTLVFLLIRR